MASTSPQRLILPILCLVACGNRPDSGTHRVEPEATAPRPTEAASSAGSGTAVRPLGVRDTGIFSDLDDDVTLKLPADLAPTEVTATVVPKHELLVLYRQDDPLKAYPLEGSAELRVGKHTLSLRPGDRDELRGLLSADRLRVLADGEKPAPGDRDDDGLPDPLDLLVGAKKTVLNGAAYGAGYIRMDFPGGDVPRHQGVCTDVVIRAVRNAGLDLQLALNRDIRRSRKSYPMVKRPNTHIDHRRVKTLLPYFRRQWQERSAALDDKSDPLRPGDVIFMDTFPSKSGPDHIGIVSNLYGKSGYPLVINNWTDGSHTAELDLLDWVPVTHRFRLTGNGR